GIPKRRCTVTVLRAVKHDVLSVLLHDGRIKCSCGFELFAPGKHDGVGGKPRPLSKTWGKRNGGASDENRHGNGSCQCRAGCKRGYFDHSRNSFSYDRPGHDGKLIDNSFFVVTDKQFTGQNSASNRMKDRLGIAASRWWSCQQCLDTVHIPLRPSVLPRDQ